MTIEQSTQILTAKLTMLEQRERDLETRITQFELQCQQWDLERQQLLTEIQQQSSQLRDAWLQLENERRDLMKASKPTGADPRPVHARQGETVAQEKQLDATNVNNTNPLPHDSGSPSPTEQFHLLRQHVFATSAAHRNIDANHQTGDSS